MAGMNLIGQPLVLQPYVPQLNYDCVLQSHSGTTITGYIYHSSTSNVAQSPPLTSLSSYKAKLMKLATPIFSEVTLVTIPSLLEGHNNISSILAKSIQMSFQIFLFLWTVSTSLGEIHHLKKLFHICLFFWAVSAS